MSRDSGNQDNSPKFISPNPTRYDGHFLYKFEEKDQAVTIGGISVNKREALVCLGVMPDNNVLTNKVINQLGSRVLDMLRNAPDEKAPREADGLTMQTYADEAELICNWAMIDLLSALKPLERLTGTSRNSIASAMGMKDCGFSLLGGGGSITWAVHKIQLNLPASLDAKLKETIEAKFQAMKDKIIAKISEEKLITNFGDRADEELQLLHRDLLRDILQDFAVIQSFITIEQRSAGESLSIANATATGAVQNALYAVQNHVYSAHGCSESQLWMKPDIKQRAAVEMPAEEAGAAQSANTFVLDTAQFSGMRQEDVLFAACLLESNKNTLTDAATAAKIQEPDNRQTIRKAHLQLKNQVDDIRSRDTHEYYIPTRLGIGRDAYWQKHMDDEIKKQRFITQYTRIVDGSTLIAAPSAAFIYEPGDLLSAAGNFAIAFGEYFSKELAAKHPVMTTGAFAMPSLYLTTVAFANAGMAPHLMHSIYTTMGKLLSGNAHIIDPRKLTIAAEEVNKAWFWLTKTHGTMQTLIMTGFAEPKILYFVTEKLVDAMISGSHQTTFAALQKLLSHGAIDTNTSGDELRNKIKTILTGVLLLGVACGLGMGAALLPQHAPILGHVKKTMEIFDNVSVGDFQSFANASGYAAHAEAFVQLFGVAQTAGLFIAKIAGVRYFLKDNLSQDDLRAFSYFIKLSQDANAQQSESDTHAQYKSIVQARIHAHPELIKIAGFTDDFLAKQQITKSSVATIPKPSADAGEVREQQPSTPAVAPQQPGRLAAIGNAIKNFGLGALGIVRGFGVFAYQSALPLVTWPLKLIVGAIVGIFAIVAAFLDTNINYRAGWDAVSKLQKRLTIEHHDSVMDGLKVRLAITKFVAMAFYMPKFFTQALYGAGVRIISGAIGVIGGIATTVAGCIDRGFSKDTLRFLGAQALKAATLIVRPLQFVGKVVSSVFIGVGAFVYSAVKNIFGSGGTGIWSDTKQTFKDWRAKLPDPTQWIKNKVIDMTSRLEPLPAESRTEKTKQFFDGINRGFVSGALKVKDTVGRGFAWMRDKLMRKPQEELQQLHYAMQKDAAEAALSQFQQPASQQQVVSAADAKKPSAAAESDDSAQGDGSRIASSTATQPENKPSIPAIQQIGLFAPRRDTATHVDAAKQQEARNSRNHQP